MIKRFEKLENMINNKSILMKNVCFNKIISNFDFLILDQDNFLNKITRKGANFKILIVDYFKNVEKDEYFVFCFDESIRLIQKSDYFIVEHFLSKYSDYNIYYASNRCKILLFQEYPQIHFNFLNENDQTFVTEEIPNFMQQFEINDIEVRANWRLIQRCISGFLIKKGYFNSITKRLQISRTERVIKNVKNIQKYITLKRLVSGASWDVYLIFNIEELKVFIDKIPNNNDVEQFKLFNREVENYTTLSHSLIPQYFGNYQDKQTKHLIIEYIEGQTLNNINYQKFEEEEIINIIFEIMIIIHYIHSNEFIYRDLKPNNIIVDSNKTAILIDFDRLKKIDKEEITYNFGHQYIAPEIVNGLKYSKEVDIYSFGLIIQNIFLNKKVSISNANRKKLELMCECCLNDRIEERKTISELIRYFYTQILIKMKRSKKIETELINLLEYNFNKKNLIDPVGFCNLGMIYGDNFYVNENEKKEDYYYSIASDQNDEISQFILGLNYLQKPNYIGKGLEYLINAADNHKDPVIQYYLGQLLCVSNIIENNYEYGVYYLKLAADQNLLIAQFHLGNLYLNPKTKLFNIEKAIYYLSLGAENKNKNDFKSKLFLDFKGKYIFTNVSMFKANFDTITCDYNSVLCPSILGILYYYGNYVKQDINKAIYYLTKVEKIKPIIVEKFLDEYHYEDEYCRDCDIENILMYFRNINRFIINSLNILGIIYLNGTKTPVDIKRAIFYFTISAKNNSLYAQYCLGEIYSNFIYDHFNICEAIHYYTLALHQDHLIEQYKEDNYSNKKFIAKEFILTSDDFKNILYYKVYAQFKLGEIFYFGTHVKKDINKAIYYFNESANNNYNRAQYYLGYIYYKGKDVPKNDKKAIHYLTLAANHNHTESQMYIGIIYYEGKIVERNINKAIQYLALAANNENQNAQLYLGIIYYEGKLIQRNFSLAISYFKKASCYYNQYAKNNLGIMYKNGQGIKKNIFHSIEYFLEAIHQKNDRIARFNLAHIYFYAEDVNIDIDKAIELLTLPSKNKIPYYIELLSLIFIQKFDNIRIDEIENEICKYNSSSNHVIASKICDFISKNKLNKLMNYFILYEKIKGIEIVYIDINENYTTRNIFELNHEKFQQKSVNKNIENVNELFYEGFGV